MTFGFIRDLVLGIGIVQTAQIERVAALKLIPEAYVERIKAACRGERSDLVKMHAVSTRVVVQTLDALGPLARERLVALVWRAVRVLVERYREIVDTAAGDLHNYIVLF